MNAMQNMDDGGHGGHEDHEEGTCPMQMMFHGGHCEHILWQGWLATTLTEFVLSALAIFVIAFLFEGLKFVRERLLRHAAHKVAQRMAHELQPQNGQSSGCPTQNGLGHGSCGEISEKSYLQRIFGATHLIQTLLNLVQVIISYFLMLIFMTYNYWLCLAVVLGLGVGYFFFGWIKKDVSESDCC